MITVLLISFLVPSISPMLQSPSFLFLSCLSFQFPIQHFTGIPWSINTSFKQDLHKQTTTFRMKHTDINQGLACLIFQPPSIANWLAGPKQAPSINGIPLIYVLISLSQPTLYVSLKKSKMGDGKKITINFQIYGTKMCACFANCYYKIVFLFVLRDILTFKLLMKNQWDLAKMVRKGLGKFKI